MPQLELHTLVVYDIGDDRTRTRVSEASKDFGLVRFQYSAFEGSLTRNRREELALVLTSLMTDRGGRVALIPVCRDDLAGRIAVEIEPTAPPARDPESPPPLRLFAETTETEASETEPPTGPPSPETDRHD